MKKMKKMSWIMSAVLLVSVAASYGSIIIDNSTITASESSHFTHSNWRPMPVDKLLGPGLNGDGSHSTVWNGLFTEGDIGTMWACGSGDTQVWVMFDLGQVYDDLESVKIWNYNRPGQTVLDGSKNINIKVSDTALAWDSASWTLNSNVDLSVAPANATTVFGDTFAINQTGVRYVLLDILTDQGDNTAAYLTGLSEVQFIQIPEPSTLGMIGLSGLVIGLIRRIKM